MSTFRAIVGAFTTTRAPWERSPSALCLPERFDSAARMASFVAHERARDHGENAVDADHLLLALLEVPEMRTSLELAGPSVGDIRALLLARRRPDARDLSKEGIMPRTSVLNWVWKRAHAIADSQASVPITCTTLFAAIAQSAREAPDAHLVTLLAGVE